MRPMLDQIARSARRTVSLVSLAAALTAKPALAWQHSWRDVTGTVTDGHHEPLRGAVIQVHNQADDSVLSYITGRSGRYAIKRLDTNTDYSISATFQGHKSKSKELSHFDTKTTRVVNLTVKMQ